MPFDGDFNTPAVPPLSAQAPGIAKMARESVLVLDMLEDMFAGGRLWLQGIWQDDRSFCLMGALNDIQVHRQPHHQAWFYLTQAIEMKFGEKIDVNRDLMWFNDSRKSYAEISMAIQTARALALEDCWLWVDHTG